MTHDEIQRLVDRREGLKLMCFYYDSDANGTGIRVSRRRREHNFLLPPGFLDMDVFTFNAQVVDEIAEVMGSKVSAHDHTHV